MMRRLLAVGCVVLAGCSTHIKYTKYNEVDGVPANGIAFALQTGAITLDMPKAAAGSGGQQPAFVENCAKNSATGETWTHCFLGVSTQATMVAAPDLYVAKPSDPLSSLSSTKLSAQPVTGSEVLYKQITVSHANNAPAVISAVGSGAAAGFALGGPPGAIVGGLIGGVVTASQSKGVTVSGAPPPPVWQDALCTGDRDRFSQESAKWLALKPSLAFPFVIDTEHARPFAAIDAQTSTDVCWRFLPNNLHLLDAVTEAGAPTGGDPQLGDGWLYRIVKTGGPQEPGTSGLAAAAYFASRDSRDDFPVSACQIVTLEITWWQQVKDALENAAAGKERPNPYLLKFPGMKIADPSSVRAVKLPDGGVITFNPDCGAFVTVTGPASYAEVFTAAITQAQAVLKAQQTWEASQAKK
jgi:hypothetical protein